MVNNRILLFLIVIILSYNKINSQSVKALTDSSEYWIGDYINYQLEIEYPIEYSITSFSIKDSIKVLDFIKDGRFDKSEKDGIVRESRTYIFSKYDSASVEISSFYINFKNKEGRLTQKKVNSIPLLIKRLEVDTKKDIMDIKSPLEIPFDWMIAFLIILSIIILTILTYLLIKYFRKKMTAKSTAEIIDRRPAHEIALEQLQNLERKKLWQNGFIKEYHSEVTLIIRTYFEKRFNILALEMTSLEVVDQLKNINKDYKLIEKIDKFLAYADLVKFAKLIPGNYENEKMIKDAREIIEETKTIIQTKLEEVNVQ